jgi:hypothetical protein
LSDRLAAALRKLQLARETEILETGWKGVPP